MSASTGPYVPPRYTCEFVIEPLFGEYVSHVCRSTATYQVEVHEYRQRARMIYACDVHLGGSINTLRSRTKHFVDNMPRWVVTPVKQATR